jgi:prepilin-type N-terminal cleavage/methylation domain-containing protein
VKTGFSSDSSVRGASASKHDAAFSLPEVMVAMVVISLVCLSVFSGMYLISRLALNNAVRSEGFRLMQAEAEHLTSLDYFSLDASPDELITSCVTTSFRPSREAQFDYPSDAAGRVTYTRRVVNVASTGTSKTLRVEVQWTWQSKTNLISVPILRYQ